MGYEFKGKSKIAPVAMPWAGGVYPIRFLKIHAPAQTYQLLQYTASPQSCVLHVKTSKLCILHSLFDLMAKGPMIFNPLYNNG